MFGFFKKPAKRGAPQPEAPQPEAGAAEAPETDIRRNVAIGELRDGLLQVLQTERGVHAETLLTVIGAIAGCAAANIVHERAGRGEARLMTVGLADGSVAYMGDDLNAYLAPEDPQIVSLWSLAAAGALQAGLLEDQLPDLGQIFGEVAGMLGGPEYGLFDSYGENKPQVTLTEAMAAWGFARKVFTRESPIFAGKILPPEEWPFVAGAVAQTYIGMTRDVLAPQTALRLVMDSAIRASKLEPRLFA